MIQNNFYKRIIYYWKPEGMCKIYQLYGIIHKNYHVGVEIILHVFHFFYEIWGFHILCKKVIIWLRFMQIFRNTDPSAAAWISLIRNDTTD